MRSIILVIICLTFTSCLEIHKSEPKTTKGTFIDSTYKPAHSEYCYHYGYNMMNGKFQWHWGMDDVPARYIVLFTFLNDTISYDSQSIYQNITDTITIIYTDQYICKKNKKDSTFKGRYIEKLVLKDTIINL